MCGANEREWRPLREVTLPTALWNPQKQPRERISYVDVSAVSRHELQIIGPASYSGQSTPGRARKIVRTGDVIFATIRPRLRRIAQIPPSLDGELVSTAFCVMRPNATHIEPDFLFYAAQLDKFVDAIAALETGASYPAVHDSDVLDQLIPVPPLCEQRNIARVLTAVRTSLLREATCETSAKALKRTAMSVLLTRGLRAEPQKPTELGLIPESWDITTLGAFFDIRHGFSFDSAGFRSAGSYVLLTPGHFWEEGGFRDLGDRTKYYVGAFDPAYIVSAGDLLIAMTEQSPGLLGSTVTIPDGDKYLHNQRLGLVVNLDQQRLRRRYLYHLMNYALIRDQISKTATGSKVKHTSPQRLLDLLAPVPSVKEQEEIAAVLDALDSLIHLHHEKATVLRLLFKSLLEKLLTGQIQISDFDLGAFASEQAAEATA